MKINCFSAVSFLFGSIGTSQKSWILQKHIRTEQWFLGTVLHVLSLLHVLSVLYVLYVHSSIISKLLVTLLLSWHAVMSAHNCACADQSLLALTERQITSGDILSTPVTKTAANFVWP